MLTTLHKKIKNNIYSDLISKRTFYPTKWQRKLERMTEQKYFAPLPKIPESEVLYNESKLERVAPVKANQRTGVLAYKIGMMNCWDAWGVRYPITICKLDRVRVLQRKSVRSDGVASLLMAIGYKEPFKKDRPTIGGFIRAKSEPKHYHRVIFTYIYTYIYIYIYFFNLVLYVFIGTTM
eukprot:GHVL01000994.1.p1 GENE.GHVL01000994.1~~GHVL01000994.1.p1  ORF type:complete len:179 (+),score=34.83 GHVL01000994.1:33-569(+)